ncbi:MAG: site-specific integrase [Aminivibrio sp.]|uniref:tyrosine-type recombinase/integrase n=1 Tax=Aminivibrio sp. TaxID=1872489 RepID=UPI002B20357E|nr:site-specific integrase [Aminivibrio sp.]MEA4951952.1 site-specific integrase [Aminivibrio sp.]
MPTIPIRKESRKLQPKDIIPLFLSFKAASGLSTRTLRDYKDILSLQFSRFPDALDHPRERTLDFLSSYQNPNSYNKTFAYLKVFWDWTMREGYFRGDRHPMDGLKKRKPRGRIVQLEEKEVARLLQQPNKGTYAGFRDYSLLCLQVDTGIRPGEALQLMPDDFHPEKMDMTVRADIAKTRTPRTLPLAAPTVDTIRKLLTIHPESWKDVPIFATETGTALQEASWSRRVKAYGKKCGLDITAYSLRHAAALLLLRKGADAFTVQALLGHSTMQMTRHYINITNEDARRGHGRAGVILSILGKEAPANQRIRKL